VFAKDGEILPPMTAGRRGSRTGKTDGPQGAGR
jgi:hypothetical protein